MALHDIPTEAADPLPLGMFQFLALYRECVIEVHTGTGLFRATTPEGVRVTRQTLQALKKRIDLVRTRWT